MKSGKWGDDIVGTALVLIGGLILCMVIAQNIAPYSDWEGSFRPIFGLSREEFLLVKFAAFGVVLVIYLLRRIRRNKLRKYKLPKL